MPKKTRNAFYYFMKDLQQDLSARGQIVAIKDMQDIADPRWRELSDEQKDYYETLAKNKRKDNPVTAEKFASDGTLITENIRIEKEIEKKESDMKRNIRFLVQNPDSIISEQSFYFISFNTLCYVVEDDKYVPLEIGIVEYSIQDGLKKYYHKFIDPGSVPFGYTCDAQTHSSETHKIPITAFEGAESDYQKIYKDILSFIKPSKLKNITPVFCLNKDIDQTGGCLVWLHEASGSRTQFQFEVYDAVLLLMELRYQVNDPFHSYAHAEDLLIKNVFDYTPNTKCAFHEEEDCSWCALGCARRLCYLLSDAVCVQYEITVTSNHLPSKVFEKRYDLSAMANLKISEKNRMHSESESKSIISDSISPNLNSFENISSCSLNTIGERSKDFSFREDQNRVNSPQPVMSSPSAISLPRQPKTIPIAQKVAAGLGIGRGTRRKES